MSVKSGQAITVLFTTQNATTGAATDADSTPTGTLYVNGTANGATVTETNITTGLYKAALTLPSLTAGDVVSLRIAATVGGVAGEGVVWQEVADTERVSDLNDLDAAGIRGAMGLGSANLDTQIAGLPTAAEVVNEWETQSQADPTGFQVNVKEVNGTAQTANDNGADINEILLDTGTDGVLVGSTQGAVSWGAQVIENAAGDALTIQSTGGNGDALVITGHGTGAGINVDAGVGGGEGVQIDAEWGTALRITTQGSLAFRGALEVEHKGTGRAVDLYAANNKSLVMYQGIDITGGAGRAIQACSDGDSTIGIDSNGDNPAIEISSSGEGVQIAVSGKGIDISAGEHGVRINATDDAIELSSSGGKDIDGDVLDVGVITSTKFDESTAYPLASVDAGVTEVARVGADGDTLETLSDQIDTVQTDLDSPNQYKADVSALATAAALATAQADLDNPDQYKADVSSLATSAALAVVDGNVDTIVATANKLDDTLEDDGGTYRFTENALEEGPSGATAAEVWANSTRTLTQTAATVTSVLTGTTLTLPRGDTWSISLTSLGSIADYAAIDFTIKSAKSLADTAALVWIRKNLSGLNDGLKILAASSSVTATNGSITIDDEDDGDITIALKATDTAGLTAGTYSYDIQKITAAGAVTTLTSGIFVLSADVGRATS